LSLEKLVRIYRLKQQQNKYFLYKHTHQLCLIKQQNILQGYHLGRLKKVQKWLLTSQKGSEPGFNLKIGIIIVIIGT
jgi:hypothetical protein